MAQNEARTDLSFKSTLSKDLSGTIGNSTVVKLQGNDISSAAPVDGYVLAYNTSDNKWKSTVAQTRYILPAAPWIKSIDSLYNNYVVTNANTIMVNHTGSAVHVTFSGTFTIGKLFYFINPTNSSANAIYFDFGSRYLNGIYQNNIIAEGILISLDGSNFVGL